MQSSDTAERRIGASSIKSTNPWIGMKQKENDGGSAWSSVDRRSQLASCVDESSQQARGSEKIREKKQSLCIPMGVWVRLVPVL